MFPSAAGVVIQGGTFISQANRASRGIDILMEWIATGAFHNSDELYDAPKCHPHTRVAVLNDIMKWVDDSSESAQDDFMMWLFGPAGAGKSAIAKRIAEIAAEKGLLIGDFFFSRTSPTRNTKDRLIATLAYQLALSIPDTRTHIENAIERDPAIFHKNILNQIDTLLIKPLQSLSPAHIIPTQKLIIIDGLDECNDTQTQVAILGAISRSFPQHNLPIKFLIVSRPEPDIVTSFDCNEPLKSIHHRLALDDTYLPDVDIRLFFSDKFEHIKRTHPLRSTIPTSWPTQEMLEILVAKSSGQFIYASTVVKFVESTCHRPNARLNIILGVVPPGKTNPFAELDALYNHLLSSVDDIQVTLRVLSLYLITPRFANRLRVSMPRELFLSLEPGDIQLALINLSSILTFTYRRFDEGVEVLHASFVDFLCDKHRSTIYYLDNAITCTNFVRQILQYAKGPDGIVAGDTNLFHGLIELYPWVPKGRLESEILNFDIDACYKASVRGRYIEHQLPFLDCAMTTLWIWKAFLNRVDLEDRDRKEALDRLNKSLDLRIQTYQSDWRLQLLVPLAFANATYSRYYRTLPCRCLDILLGMDDHDLHLADQNALDLRHIHADFLRDDTVIPHYLDHDTYASAALHCMRFLSNPPKYSERTECPEIDSLIYTEWKATYAFTIRLLPNLLEQANTLPELVQFISNHDIHPAIQNDLSADMIWVLDVHILAFLSRASVCSNWRIIFAVRRSFITAYNARRDGDDEWGMIDQSSLEENDASSDEGDIGVLNLMRQHMDQCCSNAHQNDV